MGWQNRSVMVRMGCCQVRPLLHSSIYPSEHATSTWKIVAASDSASDYTFPTLPSDASSEGAASLIQSCHLPSLNVCRRSLHIMPRLPVVTHIDFSDVLQPVIYEQRGRQKARDNQNLNLVEAGQMVRNQPDG